MGCDIHLYAEKKVGKAWICINPLEMDYDWDKEHYERTLKELDVNRNYYLFGLLSKGVRSEQDSAFEPKGYPEDMSDEVRARAQRWEGDAHSANYLTLAELDTQFKDRTIKMNGMIDSKQYKRFLATKKAKNPQYNLLYPHCTSTTAKGHQKFEEEVPVEWVFANFKEKVLDFLREFTYNYKKKVHDSNEVRIVFWFDN